MTIFETDRILVRRYEQADAEQFYQFNSDPVVMRYIRDPLTRQKSLEFLAENIEFYSRFPEYGRWAMMDKSANRYLGTFMLRPSTALQEVELGYALLTPFWGMGYATESVKGGLKYAFSELGLESVIAITMPANLASQKVLYKTGFQLEKEYQEEGRILHLFRADKGIR